MCDFFGWEGGGDEGSPDGAGGDGVYADAFVGEVEGEGAGEGDDGTFGGGVVKEFGAAAVGGDGGGVDDGGPFWEVGESGFGDVEHGEDVGAEGAFKLFGGDVGDGILGVLFGGVVDEDVEAAELLDGVFDGFAAERFVAYVAGDEVATPAFVFDEAFGFFGVFVFVEVEEGDVAAFYGEGEGDGTSDAAVSAGDESDFVLEASGALVFGFGFRLGRHFALVTRTGFLLLGREGLLGFLLFGHVGTF